MAVSNNSRLKTEDSIFIPPHPLNTAVLFLVFNRLDTTEQVFEAIRQAKPPRLYVAADGARANKDGESEKVQAVRDYIMQNIDWECEVKTLYRDQNLGCKYAVSGAITWFFENEEQGIILEDDCLPSQSFFWYCEELLERYKDDMNIAQICGRLETEHLSIEHGNNDYFITSRGFIWGWATWASRTNSFDVDFLNKDGYLKILKKLIFSSTSFVEFLHRWKNTVLVKKQIVNSWAYPWNIYQLINKRSTVLPTKNLISNVGHGVDATHTTVGYDRQKLEEIYLPLGQSKCIDNQYTVKTILNGESKFLFLIKLMLPSHVKSIMKRLFI